MAQSSATARVAPRAAATSAPVASATLIAAAATLAAAPLCHTFRPLLQAALLGQLQQEEGERARGLVPGLFTAAPSSHSSCDQARAVWWRELVAVNSVSSRLWL